MRLRERDKREVVLREPIGDEDLHKWQGPGIAIRASIYPLRDELSIKQYGAEVDRMRLLLYDGLIPLVERMGVCVDVPGGESCDYKIVSVNGWDHQRATLRWIPPDLRG